MVSDKVSVVIPSYNSARYIRESVGSVISQDYQNVEVVVVDDSSSDSSCEIIEEMASRDHRIVLLKLDVRSGAAIARNKGIEFSTGRYIAFLDADDIWLPGKLTAQMQAMQDAGAALSCTAARIINEHGEYVGFRSIPAEITFSLLLKKTPIINSSAIYDTRMLGKVKMPDVIRRQDFGLWIEIIRRSGPALGLIKPFVSYRVHSESLSRNKFISAWYTWKVLRMAGRLSMVKSLYYFSFYALGGVLGRIRGIN
ncbi:glycosyltransferase family 2 protein [Pseudomonas oligotrophica]|uniref:glycosyltransferase family 2 protein n=1 Tax=Pseudomonas oligotrophica TaxID=2912055 RepID=UPI001F328286|nr:glycosyltransferase family 2 protein [Pseudomonas oligotrophica]MCF7203585.1 glycosyltransferase [Pseudomonas oligotrophica]